MIRIPQSVLEELEDYPRYLQLISWVKDNHPFLDGHYILDSEAWEDKQIEFGLLKSRGLGDTIAKVTTALKIPQCPGCKERRKAANDIITY